MSWPSRRIRAGRRCFGTNPLENTLIKQDIVHQVIERTGLPRNKAEAAVDTMFESLKKALAAGTASSCAALGCSMCAHARQASAAIHAPARK